MKIFRKIFLWILVGLLSLGQLQRIELNNFNISLYFHDIFIVLWIFHFFFTNPIKYFNAFLIFFKKSITTLIFFSLTLFSLAINFIQLNDLTAILYFSRLVIYLIFGFSLFLLINEKQIETEYLKFQIFSIGLISLFLGFLQFIFIKDTRFLAILGWDDHYARLISTYFDPSFTGIIFLLTLLTGLSCKYLQNKKIQLFLTIIFIWGIILTFSRSSYLAVITSFTIISLSKIKFNKESFNQIILGTILFVVLLIIAPKPWGEGVNLFRTSTIKARVDAFKQQLTNLNTQTIILGNGPYSFKNSLNYPSQSQSTQIIPSHSRVPDNIFLNILLSTGIFGLLLFILLLSQWFKQLKSKNILVFAGFAGLLVHTQFNSSLIQPFVLLILLGGIATFNK